MKFQLPKIYHSIIMPVIAWLLFGVTSAILLWSFYFNHLISNYLFERVRENTFLKLSNIYGNFITIAHHNTKGKQVRNVHHDVLANSDLNSEIKKINIFNDTGKIIYSNKKSEEGKNLRSYLDRFPAGGKKLSRLSLDDKGYVYHCILVMENSQSCRRCHPASKAVLGGIEADVSLEPELRDIWKFKILVYFLDVILVVIIFISCFLSLYWYFRKPIRNLIIIMKKVETGSLALRADINARYEAKELAVGFNNMIDSMERNRQMLLNAHVFELRQMEKNAIMGKMATKLSHEIKNPLTCIHSALYSLSQEIEMNKFHQGIMLEVREQVKHLDDTIHDFLTLARPNNADCQFVDIVEIIEKTLLLVKEKATNSAIHIESDISSSLVDVHFEYNQLHKLLLNILLNAVDAMLDGGMLRVAAWQEKEKVFIEITDTGIGITPENQEKLFQAFFTSKANGTGLGLVIAKKIVESLHGFIQIQSELGKGTQVIIMLPKKK